MKGIDVATVTDLRKQLREQSVELRVIKNTLAKLAAKGTPLENLAEDFKGPWRSRSATRPGDARQGAHQVREVAAAERADWLKIKAGVLSGKRLDAAGVAALSALPGLQELRGKIVGLIAAPATQIVRILATPAQQLARVVQAHSKQETKQA